MVVTNLIAYVPLGPISTIGSSQRECLSGCGRVGCLCSDGHSKGAGSRDKILPRATRLQLPGPITELPLSASNRRIVRSIELCSSCGEIRFLCGSRGLLCSARGAEATTRPATTIAKAVARLWASNATPAITSTDRPAAFAGNAAPRWGRHRPPIRRRSASCAH